MGISLFIHRIYQCKHSASTFLAVTGCQTAVMQLCQTARIVQTDTCSPVHNSFGLIIQLVIAFEDVLTLLLWYSLSCICYAHFYLIVYHIQLHINPTPTRCELQRIRQQVADYLFQFIAISPSHQLVFHAESVQRQPFLLDIKLERITDVVHQFHHIYLLHTQAQTVVLQLIKVHQLVHQLKHALNAALGNT